MRDPNRIGYILEGVERVWRLCPELRLGQLLVGVARNIDLFYIEDDILLRKLEELEYE